ncbi:TetR family transcriptional regulator [Amycolatopsis alkalitolerans]|uniref:TetR family transcriptional regulator n=1 Tax=Amycolatopsis alkalitolerans TaxID=2547244 RepID=A0A5C4M5N2_9PSEU|nr:TetR family transcriptional regulator [Amycolatopsis alkalitolerans]TNC28115.1 TetR family transcriptional regulator [Amycolatopsis alkalitolerans]
MNLRERKKSRTRETISNTAIDLFFVHGYAEVSITQIAEAAEVSRRTLFTYFPAKEDLVVHRFADHETEAARVVRGGQARPLAALRAHFLEALRDRDPITGLSDRQEVLELYRLVRETPALMNRMLAFNESGERALADALREKVEVTPLVASLAAAQIAAVRWRLALTNNARVSAGSTADEAYPVAVDEAEQGFQLLAEGLEAVL